MFHAIRGGTGLVPVARTVPCPRMVILLRVSACLHVHVVIGFDVKGMLPRLGRSMGGIGWPTHCC